MKVEVPALEGLHRMRSWSIRRRLIALPLTGRLLAWCGGWRRGAPRTLLDERQRPLPPPTAPTAHAHARDGDAPARVTATDLHRSAEFLAVAQAAGGCGVFDLDLVTGQVTGTPLFYELLGLEPRATLFTREEWLATVHPEHLEHVIQQLNAAIAAGGTFQTEYRVLLLDGAPRWLAGRGSVLRDADGCATRAIGTLTDISARKQLEESLRYTQESLNAAQAVAGVATMDLDFGAKRCVASANYLELLGLPPTTRMDDLEGQLTTIHPEDVSRVRRAPFAATPANPSYHCEYRVQLGDGGERWIAETATVGHDAHGQLTRITGSLVDVTHLKRSELAAEASNRAKSDFLANVSHEIRTPMNGVIGMSEMLAETSLDAQQREYVDIIRGSATALLSLINDVLDLSKIEAGRLDLESVPFDLRDVLYETVAVMALQAATKGIEVVVEVHNMPVRMRGDPGRLRQIIMNLVGNAIKFTPEGHIAVTVSPLASFDGDGLGGHDGPRLMRIEVVDTGIGIPADRLDRLFQTFSQIDASTTRYYGGSGLGLSIVKRLTELMGGEVGVNSAPGAGSTFWVTVPLAPLAEQPALEQVGVGQTVLIVDDVAASRHSLAQKLALHGFATRTAGSVAEALAWLAAGPSVQLVLADELMPLRGGLELLAALRAEPRHAGLPFILLSLFGAEHDLARWPHRPDAIGTKPLSAVKLAALVTGVLTGHTPPMTWVPAPPRDGVTFRGRRILLVEDHPVNQRVAQRALEKLAAVVTVAHHGAEALERIAETAFDAVLMDCQMPVMDGFTATRRIRERERSEPRGYRLPIIALSANVMSQDRDQCRAAGMDAHLAKPLEPGQLAACLSRYLKADQIPAAVDLSALRALTGGDPEFERELVQTFIDSGDRCMADIRHALDAQDLATVGQRAHVLKGASANIHAHPLSAAAGHLESAARAQAVHEIDALVRQVTDRLQAVTAELRKAC